MAPRPPKRPVLYVKSETGYGAYVPDLPGCVVAGETLEETTALIKGAIEFHLEGMREDGFTPPEPRSCRLRRSGNLSSALRLFRVRS